MAFGKKKKMTRLIREMYGKRYNLGAQQVVMPSGYLFPESSFSTSLAQWNPFRRMTRSQKMMLWFALAGILMAIKLSMAVYYYNLLVDTQQNMFASYANVNALMQRRNDIAQNLSKAVYDYSKHEQHVFTSIVSLRSFLNEDTLSQDEQLRQLQEIVKSEGQPSEGKGAALSPEITKGADLLSSLSKLIAVAEQYPDLKLSANFDSLMAALVQVETDLASERIKFNEQTNIYTTNVARFPCNVFAWIFRFEDFNYFEANDQAKTFKLIGY